MPLSFAHMEMVRRLPLAIPEMVLAEHFEVTLKTWQAMRERGEGPPWVEAGHRVIYIRDCVLLWLELGQDAVAPQAGDATLHRGGEVGHNRFDKKH